MQTASASFTETPSTFPFCHYCTFHFIVYSKDQSGKLLFLLNRSKGDTTFSGFAGTFTKKDVNLHFAIAREFISRTKGLLYTPNLKYFTADSTELPTEDLIIEEDFNSTVKPQKGFSIPVNDVCKVLCEHSHIFQDKTDHVSYYTELPLMNPEKIDKVALEKNIDIELRYFTLEEILQSPEICKEFRRLFAIPDHLSYIQTHLQETRQTEAEEHYDYAILSCDSKAKTYMLHSLHYSTFKKHGEKWRFYKPFEGDVPSDEVLAKLKGIIIPGSGHSAYEDLEWYPDFFALIKKIVNEYKNIKLLGICFGAQIISQALGGKVVKMQREFRRGGDRLEVAPSFYKLDYVKALKLDPTVPLVIGKAHGDHIVDMPEGAIHHMSSGTTHVEAFTLGENILAFQGHPEFNDTWIVGAHYRAKKLNEADYEKFEDAFIDEHLKDSITQETLLKICYSFLKSKSE